jgi:hypothetical protein
MNQQFNDGHLAHTINTTMGAGKAMRLFATTRMDRDVTYDTDYDRQVAEARFVDPKCPSGRFNEALSRVKQLHKKEQTMDRLRAKLEARKK